MADPKETRMVQTRNGVAQVPRAQTGIPIRDYLQNAELPKNLERAVIFETASGPVALEADPIPWTHKHDEKVGYYAETLKEQIEDKGFYAKSLDRFANRLSSETGYPTEEMKATISSKFTELYGNDPFQHLQNVRAERGLPVRERQPAQDQRLEPSQ